MPPLRQRNLEYQKMSDVVADTLQRMIVEDELKPGQKVTQDEVARMLGVSTMPVREALLKLAALGLVEASPNRSFRVINSTENDLRDSYWMQSVLTGELTRRACVNAGASVAPELQHWLQAYTDAAENGDTAQLEKTYRSFYRVINLAADSPRLVFMLQTNLRFMPILWYPRIQRWIPLSKQAHKKIITAFKQGDADRAAQVASEHMIAAGQLLLEYFESTGRWNSPARSAVR